MSSETYAVFERVVELLSSHSNVDTTITPETRIVADLAIDSVEMFDLMMEIEETFEISFSVEESAEIETVGALTEAIIARTGE